MSPKAFECNKFWINLCFINHNRPFFAHLLLLVPVGFYSPVPVLWDVVADRDLEHCKTSPVFHCECLAVDRGLSLEADCLDGCEQLP